jgi:hypothetical protein
MIGDRENAMNRNPLAATMENAHLAKRLALS